MRRYLLATAAVFALAAPAPANATALSINPLADADVVPQSVSDPCIICATTQAHNPVGFGYNNFISTGNDSSFNLFSSNTTGAFGNGDDLTVTPYSVSQIAALLLLANAANTSLSFGVAVDVNSTGAKSEVLTTFRLLDLDRAGTGPLGSLILFDLASTAIPDIRNGNGSADYLITGFDLQSLIGSGIIANGDRLLFQASWDHAVDGGESFYIVPLVAAVPGPIVGAGFPGLLAGCLALWGLNKRRRNRLVSVA
jgi:hypothetical protein